MCRARCITHQGKIISATGVHNHPPHMRGNSTGSSSCGPIGGSGSTSVSSSSVPPTSSQSGSSSGVGISPASTSLRFSQNYTSSGTNNQHNYHDHHHSVTSPLPPSTFASNQHIHSGAGTTSSGAAQPHLFLQSMPNLLVQHYPSSQSTHMLQQPSFQAQNNNVLHNYEMSSTMESSPPHEQPRNSNSSFDSDGKTLETLNKDHLSEVHIPVHNAAAISPTDITHDSEIVKKISSTEHQQVQVIDSITISPGNSHNFKMETM